MACFCRTGRGKKGNGQDHLDLGRITGSDSIDTLVRIGLAKQTGVRSTARRVMLKDFTKCAHGELSVKKGDVVYILYRDHEWLYVITEDGREGFVPFTFCTRRNSNISDTTLNPSPEEYSRQIGMSHISDQVVSLNRDGLGTLTNNAGWSLISEGSILPPHQRDKLQRSSSSIEHHTTNELLWHSPMTKSDHSISTMLTSDRLPTSYAEFDKISRDIRPFVKDNRAEFVVLFNFEALDENDLDVRRGEVVTVLNDEDREWSWVSRGDMRQGFVPYSFLCPILS